ncbi:MAG: Ig-like domain-containing protein, partial [Acetobacteraceae bacterium]
MTRLLPFHPIRVASLRQARVSPPPGASVTIATPVSPQDPNRLLLVSGTYSGAATSLTVVWRQGGGSVGVPVEATVEDGLWTAVVTTPETVGAYTLRATLNGTVSAESGLVTIAAADPSVQARLEFYGTGLPAGTIDLFGHAFPQGAIPAGQPVVLRDHGGAELYRTQMDVKRRWPDQSVMTAVFAAELPAIAEGATLAADIVVGTAHPSPGPDLSLAALLAGRTARIRTWAPGDNGAPLWTFDVIPPALAATERWHAGPLAVQTRVETPMPASANVNGSRSVRLIVDVCATKDGFLELDVCWSNDRLPFTSQDLRGTDQAVAAEHTIFGYTIEIDGVIVYDQRPDPNTPAAQLQRYARWIRRRGRRNEPASPVIGYWVDRPAFRPDAEVIFRSGVSSEFLTDFGNSQIGWGINNHTTEAIRTARENDPYWHWSMARGAGDVGGRPEIGHRTFSTAIWLTEGGRRAQFLTQRMFEAAAVRGMHYYDWEDGEWINPPAWPRFTLDMNAPFSEAGTPKSLATRPTVGPGSNQTDHITVDKAHHGSFNWGPAVLGGRRLAYDELCARVAWVVAMNARRLTPNYDAASRVPTAQVPTFRDFSTSLSHVTGDCWCPILGVDQARSQSWDFRCVIDAAAILPDDWPNRVLYERHCEAYFNGYARQTQQWFTRWPEALGVFFPQSPEGIHNTRWQNSFITPSFVIAQRLDIGGPNRDVFITGAMRAHTNWVTDPGFNHRLFLRGAQMPYRGGGVDATTWAQIGANTIAADGDVPESWTGYVGEGDWQRNGPMGISHAAFGLDVPLEVKADARDALVLINSERVRPETGLNANPRFEPSNYFGSSYQTNGAWSRGPGISVRRNAPPVILPGQMFRVRADAPAGTIVGVIEYRGPLPRNSAAGRATQDAFVIVSQPAGNPFSVSMGGVIRLVNPAAMTSGPMTLQVYCRTWEQRMTT